MIYDYGGTNGIYDTVGVGSVNRKKFYSSGSNFISQLYDSAGASEDSASRVHLSATTEQVHRQVWDQSASGGGTGGYEQVSILNGVTVNGGASPFEGAILGAATTEITLGDFDGGGNANNCLIQRVTSYDGVNGAIP